IVTIFDAGETEDGRTYIAMERLDGETLASRVASEGLPPLPMVIELASQMAAALDYAHGQGVIHHDIKPRTSCWPRAGTTPSSAISASPNGAARARPATRSAARRPTWRWSACAANRTTRAATCSRWAWCCTG